MGKGHLLVISTNCMKTTCERVNFANEKVVLLSWVFNYFPLFSCQTFSGTQVPFQKCSISYVDLYVTFIKCAYKHTSINLHSKCLFMQMWLPVKISNHIVSMCTACGCVLQMWFVACIYFCTVTQLCCKLRQEI